MSNNPIRILLAEDNVGDARLLAETLRECSVAQFELTHEECLRDALARLRAASYDVFLLDLSLPDSQGLDTVNRAYRHAPQVPIIVLTGTDDEAVGLEAVRRGAQDYLVKGQTDGRLLLRAIRYATQRKQVESDLARAKQRLELAQKAGRVGTFEWDVSAPGTVWTDGMETVYGVPSGEIVGTYETWRQQVHPKDIAVAEQAVQDALAGKAEYNTEYRILWPDGSIHWVGARGQVLRDEQGRPVRMIGVNMDITERKQAEDVLRFLASCSATPGETFFQSLARYLAETLGMDFVCIDRLAGDTMTAQTEAMFVNGKFEDNVSYALKDTPCGDVVGKTVCCFPAGVRHLFPKDAVLQDMGAESYVGVTLWSHTGKPIGLIAVIGSRPLANPQLAESVLKLVAVRAAGELERKRAEEALRATHERIEKVLEVQTVGVMFWDLNTGCLLDANDAFLKMMGYTRSDVEAHNLTWQKFTPPEYHDVSREEIAKFMVTGRVGPYEKEYFRKDGTRQWLLFAGSSLGNNQCVEFCVDISDRKRAEAALRESEERLRLLGDNLPTSAVYQYTHEPDGTLRFLYISAGIEQLLGVKPEDVLRDPATLHARILPEYFAALVEGEAVSKRELSVFDMEVQMRRADGEVRWMHLRSGPRRLADGQVVWDGVQTDVTERKWAEEKLKEWSRTLEQRVAERTAVAEHRATQLRALAAQLTHAEQKERQRLALVLHDHLQQLLVGMKFSISMLRSHVQGDDGFQVLRQLGDIVDESIDTSRGLTIELCPPILTKGTMSEVLHWLAGWFASKHGLQVEVLTDEQVHPPAEEVRSLLFQATRELLFNIVKHAGVSEARVEMDRLEDGRVCVTVTDEGAGFDFTLVKPGSDGKGGFGLFSLRERLEMIGGELQIDSAPGKGTRSVLIAPMQLVGSAAGGAETPAGEARLTAVSKGLAAGPSDDDDESSIRVLLADDHKVMRDGLERLLQLQRGIKVVGQAADGLQVVDMALQLKPDIIIMDVTMPHLDGVEATRRIRRQLPGTQVIGLSMFREVSVQEAMLDAGAATYLAKTSGPEALIAAIRQCVPPSSRGRR